MKINSQLPIRHWKRKKSVVNLLAGFTISLLCSNVYAVEVTKKLAVSTGLEYDSNPAMANDNKQAVWIYSIAPQFQLDVNDDVNRWYLDTGFLVQRYSNEKVLAKRDDPRVAVGWDRTYESGMFGIKAEYQERSSRVDELKNTGIYTSNDNTEKTKMLAAKWQHALRPKWDILTEGAYYDVTFSIPGSLDSYELSEIKSQLSYANTEKLDTNVQVGFAQLNPNKVYENTDLWRLVMGANYQVSESFRLLPRAGVYNLSGRQTETDWEAGVKADYVINRMNYSGEIGRELYASGVGGFRKTDFLRLGLLFNISENNQVGAGFSFDKNIEDLSVGIRNLITRQANVYYDHVLSNHWKSRFSATHRQFDASGDHPEGNVIGVSVVYDTLSF